MSGPRPDVDPLLDTLEFRRLMRQAVQSGRLGVSREEIVQYADSMVTNYPDDAAHILATCRLLRGVLAGELRFS